MARFYKSARLLALPLMLFSCQVLAQHVSPEAKAKPPVVSESLSHLDSAQFADKPYVLSNGIKGIVVKIPSHSPVDYGPLLKGELGPPVMLTGQLFLPASGSKRPFPAVVETPGSGGLDSVHLAHAAALTSAGIAVVVIDPFFSRGIKNTVANQNQLSFAASAYDVLASVKFLRARKDIDAERIGATGGSRGGTAVLTAEAAPVSDAILGPGEGLRAVVAGYPWCGVQFHSGRLTAHSSLLVMQGDHDDWVSYLQCQDETHAMQVAGQDVVMELFPGARHSFDREGVPPTTIPDAVTSLTFPTVYMDDQGQYYNMRTGKVDPSLPAQAIAQYSIKGGFLKKGVTIGSEGTQAKEFSDEMVNFFKAKLLH
jgi:dienelactone hydrolase